MAEKFVEIVRCSVGAEQYGIRRTQVQSVQHGNRTKVYETIDGSFDAMLPTTQGDLPVFRLTDMFGWESDSVVAEQRLLVLRSEDGLWCLLVDSVSQAELVSAENISPLPSVVGAGVVDSVYTKGDDVLMMLAPQLMLSGGNDSAETPARDYELNLDTISASGEGHLVLFTLPGLKDQTDKYTIALTPKQIDEVLRQPTVRPVPTASGYVRGMLNWRGRIVPVLDLGQRLGLRDTEHRFSSLDRVIVSHGFDSERFIAFYADSDVEILDLPAPHRAIDLPAPLDSKLARGAARYGGRTVVIPHLENLATVR